MNEKRDRELESSENWDYERLEVRGPVKASRVVVSVAFPRQDFTRVSAYAEHVGKKVSAFIREAALEKATGRGGSSPAYGSGTIRTDWWHMPAITGASGSPRQLEEAPVTTY